MEKEMGIVTVTGKDALVVTDKYGDSLIVEKYGHRIDGEERVQLFLDNEKREFRDILEENDIKVDLSKEGFIASLKAILGALEDEKPKNVVLSDEERKIIEAHRNGAKIDLIWHGLTKVEAEKAIREFGEVYYCETSNDELDTKWLSHRPSGKYGLNFDATAFYK